jgi:hypothetical protein
VARAEGRDVSYADASHRAKTHGRCYASKIPRRRFVEGAGGSMGDSAQGRDEGWAEAGKGWAHWPRKGWSIGLARAGGIGLISKAGASASQGWHIGIARAGGIGFARAGGIGFARANEFAATTTRNPPSRIGLPGWWRRVWWAWEGWARAASVLPLSRRSLPGEGAGGWGTPGPASDSAGSGRAIEIAATTSRCPPSRTRRPGGVRRPKHLRVRNRAMIDSPLPEQVQSNAG